MRTCIILFVYVKNCDRSEIIIAVSNNNLSI